MDDDVAAVAYVSWGLWVADCPRPDCLGAEHHGHAPITGHVGGLTQTGFRCSRCGLLCGSRWPDNAAEITWALGKRPLPETRNWRPGETVRDLIVENTAHGIEQPELDGPGVVLVNDRVHGLQLGAAHRLMIGAGR